MTIDEKVMKQLMRRRTKEWIDERTPMIREERDRLLEEPVYQVLANVAGYKADDIPAVPTPCAFSS
jgi:hypothetical protein